MIGVTPRFPVPSIPQSAVRGILDIVEGVYAQFTSRPDTHDACRKGREASLFTLPPAIGRFTTKRTGTSIDTGSIAFTYRNAKPMHALLFEGNVTKCDEDVFGCDGNVETIRVRRCQ